MKLTHGTAALEILLFQAVVGQHSPTLCITVMIMRIMMIMMIMRSGMMMRRAREMGMAPRRTMRVAMMMMGGAGAASYLQDSKMF